MKLPIRMSLSHPNAFVSAVDKATCKEQYIGIEAVD